jgi:hypothetical protein
MFWKKPGLQMGPDPAPETQCVIVQYVRQKTSKTSVEVKGKFVPVYTIKPHEGRGVELHSHIFLTSTLDTDK